MSPGITLRIGAGRGPWQARRFVAMLADALVERLVASGAVVQAVERHGDPAAPGRVVLRLTAAAAVVPELVGTHLLTAELRGPRARRRWFAAVELDAGEPAAALVLPRAELDVRFVRSRGPGGQNVNKRATAVQLTHRPTGIAVHCDTHRSQARNLAAAREGLHRAVARHLHEHDRNARRNEAWQARRELTTHTPVMCWRLHATQADVVVPAATAGHGDSRATKLAVMPQDSNAEIGQRLAAAGRLDELEKAIANDDAMAVVMMLEDVGVETETISRMLLQLDKDYLLALVDAGRAAG